MDPANLVGVGILRTDPARDNLHVGLVYVDPKGERSFAHLAFHNDLRKEPPPDADGYLWDDCAWLAEPRLRANAEAVAVFIETCVRRTDVPYGMDPPDDAFDAQGRYDELDPSKGLTCATFIAAVMKSVGFPVVDLTTWENRVGDEQWKQSVLRLLRRHCPDRARQVEGSQARFRLRPEEIAAATAATAIPVEFKPAVEMGAALREIALQPQMKPTPT